MTDDSENPSPKPPRKAFVREAKPGSALADFTAAKAAGLDPDPIHTPPAATAKGAPTDATLLSELRTIKRAVIWFGFLIGLSIWATSAISFV